MVRANFERLITTHHKADLLGLFVLEETNIAGATFLPFRRASIETEQLGAPITMYEPPLRRSKVDRSRVVGVPDGDAIDGVEGQG